METSEEHLIISESTTFFTSQHHSESHSQTGRRAASVGPGTSDAHSNPYDEVWAGAVDGHSSPTEEDSEWLQLRSRAPPRSASALPGTHDNSFWRRDGHSRRPSFEEDNIRLGFGVNGLNITERGPSPAYTPRPEYAEGSRRSSLRQATGPIHESILSPIQSAEQSRATSDRTDSKSTERRLRPDVPGASPLSGVTIPADVVEESDGQMYAPLGQPSRSILTGAGHRHDSGNSNLRFAEQVHGGPVSPSNMEGTEEDRNLMDSPQDATGTFDLGITGNRAASLRSMSSAHSGSTTSLHGNPEHRPGGELHPVASNIQPISGYSTRVNTPAPSIRAHSSNENLPLHRESSSGSDGPSAPPSGVSSRRSSMLYAPGGARTGTSTPGLSDVGSEPEVRQGRQSRHGSASTIVFNNGTGPAGSGLQSPRQSISGSSGRVPSNAPVVPLRSANGTQEHLPRSNGHSREPSEDGRGRKGHKFSLSAALRGLSKGRASSKSRTREEGAPRSRPPSISEPVPPLPSSRSKSRNVSGSAVLDRLLDEPSRSRRSSRDAVDFVPPFGRGGAARVSTSRERQNSPSREGSRSRDVSPNRGRGRNKGMKVLTGAFGIAPDHEPGEDVHNWKEFRKGTYNYPISFPIPINTPPTIHAEFGSVVYKLKATVKRVGALTANLVEEMEVTMIATPQEDDMEETENVIVERQWEEQMRYQISLSGKAFPIGGTM
jgi:hypothetical protein